MTRARLMQAADVQLRTSQMLLPFMDGSSQLSERGGGQAFSGDIHRYIFSLDPTYFRRRWLSGSGPVSIIPSCLTVLACVLGCGTGTSRSIYLAYVVVLFSSLFCTSKLRRNNTMKRIVSYNLQHILFLHLLPFLNKGWPSRKYHHSRSVLPDEYLQRGGQRFRYISPTWALYAMRWPNNLLLFRLPSLSGSGGNQLHS